MTEGLRRFYRLDSSVIDTDKLESMKSKFGELYGTKSYYLSVRYSLSNDKAKKLPTVSKISTVVFNSIIDRINLVYPYILDDVFYGDNEMRLDTGSDHGDLIGFRRYPDFLFKSKKIIIEFQGDYWHKRPKSPEFSLLDITEDIENDITNDYYKLKSFRNLGYQVFYIHENEYRSNPDTILEECIKFITNKEFRDEYTSMLDSVL